MRWSVETLVLFFAVYGPKFTTFSKHAQERLQFATPFSVDDILFYSGDIGDQVTRLSKFVPYFVVLYIIYNNIDDIIIVQIITYEKVGLGYRTVDCMPCAAGALAPPIFAIKVCAEWIAGVETSTTAEAM